MIRDPHFMLYTNLPSSVFPACAGCFLLPPVLTFRLAIRTHRELATRTTDVSMVPQDILASFKQARAASHFRSAPSSPTGGNTKSGQAFFLAKHSASKLETWHICAMTKGFDAACPGDVTNTIITIAPDKVKPAHLGIRFLICSS